MSHKAYVLINTETTLTQSVLQRLKQIHAVIDVHEVLGPYDIVVELEAPTQEDLVSALRHDLRPIKGITSTVTCTWL